MSNDNSQSVIEPIAPPFLHEKVFDIATALPGTKILDVPTGYGALAQKFLDVGKLVTAGDINIDKFKGLRNHPNLTLVRMDLNEEQLSLPGNHFDIAVSVEGIEHLQRQWDFVRNLFRVLKPGGYLILTTPNILNIRSRLRFFMEGRYEHFKRPLVRGKSWDSDIDNYHIAPISYFELQFILKSVGFDIMHVHTNRYAEKNFFTLALKPLFAVFYNSKNRRDTRRNRGNHKDLYRLILSDEFFFGESLIIVAQKQEASAAST